MKNIIGKRVIVAKGTRLDRCIDGNGHYKPENEQTTRSEFQMWIAGDVPVGSTGTVIEGEYMPQIKWDDNRQPKEGYTFGITSLDDSIREITQ